MPAFSSPLVSVASLAQAQPGGAQDPPVLLDVRYRLGGPPARPDYDAAHLPGAVFVDVDTDLAAPPGPHGRHPLPDPAALQRVLRAAGIGSGSRVVVYDDGNGLAAVRAWWLLRWAGLPAGQVAVLDGGYAAWCAAGHPTTAEVPDPEPGDLVVRPGSMPTVDADGAARLARAGTLLDARAAARYRGETEPIDPVAGHIPGAVNVPVTDLVSDAGTWLPVPELAARFAGLADQEGVPVGAYCGSGVTAAALVLAVEQAGLRSPEEPITLYPGSWSNWVADPTRPVATGGAP